MGEKVEWRHIIMYILIIYVEYPAVMLPLDNGSKFIDPLSNGSMCFQIKRENVCTFLTGRENGNMCKVFLEVAKKERVQTEKKVSIILAHFFLYALLCCCGRKFIGFHSF